MQKKFNTHEPKWYEESREYSTGLTLPPGAQITAYAPGYSKREIRLRLLLTEMITYGIGKGFSYSGVDRYGEVYHYRIKDLLKKDARGRMMRRMDSIKKQYGRDRKIYFSFSYNMDYCVLSFGVPAKEEVTAEEK